MIKTSVLNYPRIGENRELKKAVEGFLKGNLTKEELEKEAKALREKHLKTQVDAGIDYVSCNDFSLYDIFLDTAVLLNAIPKRYFDLNLDETNTYFAIAKGYQGNEGDVKALPMKKWFNTNYHYIVPEIDETVEFKLNDCKILRQYKEAKELSINTKVSIVGPFTFLKLADIKIQGKDYTNFIENATKVYIDLLASLNNAGVELVQIEEPILVTDLDNNDRANFKNIYSEILKNKGNAKVLLQTYFGDVRDVYEDITTMDFDALGLDFIEGKKTLELIEKNGFPKEKTLFAGVINGKNVWVNNYENTINLVNKLRSIVSDDKLVIGTSTSLLHVPYTLRNEKSLSDDKKKFLAFGEEKLNELSELKTLLSSNDYNKSIIYVKNKNIIEEKKTLKSYHNDKVRSLYADIKNKTFGRKTPYEAREKLQADILKLPILPTTTIGSFPQTSEVRKNRREFKNGLIDNVEYTNRTFNKIKQWIDIQEEIGLDVLVHGEYERNDMVEYFGENLEGFIFTENAWVQSYGTRGLKPPIIFGDISRKCDFTVKWTSYANSLTAKPVKGMLTGPVTILNWSFPREDISLKETCYQIALAMKEEVMALEANGIKIIQIDEAALREKLPLRKEDWREDYLEWAIKSFRLVTEDVKDETQIHTHMCYSEFKDIIEDIKNMDADVITIETAKTDLAMLDTLKNNNYKQGVGPGVYDVHSPRVPTAQEFKDIISKAIDKIGTNLLWINPDCGLKTRGEEETIESLKNMVIATKSFR